MNNFVKNAIKIHGNKYDYSLVKYINNKTKVKIICSKHGIFEQRPNSHISKKSICPKCSYENRVLTTNEFVNRAKNIHGNKYNYSETEYIKSSMKVKIFCPKHGFFNQLPHHHLSGNNCLKCKLENSRISLSNFIERSNKIHNNKFDYSLVKFNINTDKIKIICPKHGIFKQRVGSHLEGYDCRKCSIENIIKNGKKTRIKNGIQISNWKLYRKNINNLTKRIKKELFKNWNGVDYYDGENIKENFSLDSGNENYPTIDHKISVYYGFINNINPEIICNMDNLCITKRGINSKKGTNNNLKILIK